MELQRSFDKHGLQNDSILKKPELKEFYSSLKSINWVIVIEESFESKPPETVRAMGFSVDNYGSVLTCMHVFKQDAISRKIRMRRLDGNGFLLEGNLVYYKSSWDLAFLRVKDYTGGCFGKLATDESIFAGQMLLHIGDPSNFIASFLSGTAAYPCVNVVVPTGGQTCGEYKPNALQHTPNYRVMGDIWNSNYFASVFPDDLLMFSKNLDPLMAVIQINGLVCGGGSSGGPLFNVRGEIVGIINLGAHGSVFATHVAMLKHFVNVAKHSIELGSMKKNSADNKEAGCSKEGLDMTEMLK